MLFTDEIIIPARGAAQREAGMVMQYFIARTRFLFQRGEQTTMIILRQYARNAILMSILIY